METLTRAEFTRRISADRTFVRRFREATSPGPVAARLGVSRQRVYKMLQDGVLDGVRVLNGDGRTDFVLVFEDGIEARERRTA